MPLICLFSHFSLHILNHLLTEAHIYISNIYDRDGNTGWLNCCLLPAYPLPPSSTIPILLPCLKFRWSSTIQLHSLLYEYLIDVNYSEKINVIIFCTDY